MTPGGELAPSEWIYICIYMAQTERTLCTMKRASGLHSLTGRFHLLQQKGNHVDVWLTLSVLNQIIKLRWCWNIWLLTVHSCVGETWFFFFFDKQSDDNFAGGEKKNMKRIFQSWCSFRNLFCLLNMSVQSCNYVEQHFTNYTLYLKC